jgi:hypothetical protein
MPTVKLDWNDNNVDETGHEIYRSTSSIDTGSPGSPLASIAANLTTYSDATADEGINYFYRVAAIRNSDKAFSSEIQVAIPSLSYDSDAQVYFTAVEAADGQPLESEVKDAVNAFVTGCKADGIWDAMEQVLLLCAANSLTGALVPLKGVVATNFNFISSDYNRKTGLKGNLSKYLNTNFSLNSTHQDNIHISVFRTEPENTTASFMLVNVTGGNSVQLYTDASSRVYRVNSGVVVSDNTRHLGLIGASRSSPGTIAYRYNNVTSTANFVSSSVDTTPIQLFGRYTSNSTVARMSFASIGQGLDLGLLNARVTTLMNTFNTVIV